MGDEDVDTALADLQRGFEGVNDPRAIFRGKADSVLNDFERVVAPFHPVITLLCEQVPNFLFAEILRNWDRERNEQFCSRRLYACALRTRKGCGYSLLKVFVDRIGRVPPHRFPAAPAEQPGGPGEKQLQVVVEFRHRADRGTRRFDGIGLVDGDGRRDAVDAVGLRFVHAIEELSRVGGERLDVTALSLGVNRVECQRRFSRTADAGDDDQLVQRQPEVDSLEIVLPRANNFDELA